MAPICRLYAEFADGAEGSCICRVHKNTCFRWRHRFLQMPKTERPERLGGITDADETYFLDSEKGSRKLGREPRRRGGAATKRGTSDEQICVLIARDRTGQTIDFVTGNGPVTKANYIVACQPCCMTTSFWLLTRMPPTNTLPRESQNPQGSQLTSKAPSRRCVPHSKCQRLPQSPQRVDLSISRRGNALFTLLLRVALGVGPPAN